MDKLMKLITVMGIQDRSSLLRAMVSVLYQMAQGFQRFLVVLVYLETLQQGAIAPRGHFRAQRQFLPIAIYDQSSIP